MTSLRGLRSGRARRGVSVCIARNDVSTGRKNGRKYEHRKQDCLCLYKVIHMREKRNRRQQVAHLLFIQYVNIQETASKADKAKLSRQTQRAAMASQGCPRVRASHGFF